MNNERHDVKQLSLDFDAKEQVLRTNAAFSGLSLIVNNCVPPQFVSTSLQPNSPEITEIIRSLGKSLSW